MEIKSINPINNQVLKTYSVMTGQEVHKAIEAVQHSWLKWRDITFEERASLFKNLANELEKNKAQYAETITNEMGKVLNESIAEVEKCAKVCLYYAEHGEAHLQTEDIITEANVSRVSYQPLGIVLGIMPWNFPFWQVFRYAVPTLMAGNATILKHAPNVFQCADLIIDSFDKAGFPPNLIRSLVITNEATENLIAHPLVKAVTLTGSTRAGKAVAKKAGEYLKKCVLELGGNDPYIVLADADLDLAVETCVKSRLLNAGQSCIAAKRFIVVTEVYDDFLKKFKTAMSAKSFGDPTSGADIGPMARKDLRDELHKQVEVSIQKGSTCILGGEIPDSEGFFYPPTILTNVKKGMPAFDEELFGPVASVIKAEDESHAVELANESIYGLGAALFTTDLEKGEEWAETKLDAGCCFVNQLVHSDPRLPFGGIKESGYGRELGQHGIREFVNAKTIYVK